MKYKSRGVGMIAKERALIQKIRNWLRKWVGLTLKEMGRINP